MPILNHVVATYEPLAPGQRTQCRFRVSHRHFQDVCNYGQCKIHSHNTGNFKQHLFGMRKLIDLALDGTTHAFGKSKILGRYATRNSPIDVGFEEKTTLNEV